MEYDFISSLAPNTYFDRQFNCDAVKILPGEYFVTQRDLVIVTVLGSCVSVCLRDHVSGIGGMNHCMLPGNNDGGISPMIIAFGRRCHALRESKSNRLSCCVAKRSRSGFLRCHRTISDSRNAGSG